MTSDPLPKNKYGVLLFSKTLKSFTISNVPVWKGLKMLSFIFSDRMELFFNMTTSPLLLRRAMRTVYSLLLNNALNTGDVDDMLLLFDAV
jgi:hypothetical protein